MSIRLNLAVLFAFLAIPAILLFAQDPTISDAEYAIDSDPGAGSATGTQPNDGAFDETTESVQITIPTDNLSVGTHMVYVRMKNSEGDWGVRKAGIFVVEPPSERTIASGEYFLDDDPGRGEGNAISAIDGSFDESSESIETSIQSNDLSLGNHVFVIRMQDSEGNWGPKRSVGFRVSEETGSPTSFIAGAEYYLDTEPSPGNGQPLWPSDGSFNSRTENFGGVVPTSNISIGDHWLYTRVKDNQGQWSNPDSNLITVREPTAIDADSGFGLPTKFRVFNNYPNPFNPNTTIRYGVPQNTQVKLVVYDIRGNLVKTLVDEREDIGWYQIQWDGTNENGSHVSTGVYFYRLVTKQFTRTNKMILIK